MSNGPQMVHAVIRNNLLTVSISFAVVQIQYSYVGSSAAVVVWEQLFFGMAGVAVVEVPLDLNIKLLDNVLIPSFGFRPPLSDEARESWIRERLGSEFREELMVSSKTIMNLETALSEFVRLERQRELLILQQQSASKSTHIDLLASFF
jgi:hypothetical protein